MFPRHGTGRSAILLSLALVLFGGITPVVITALASVFSLLIAGPTVYRKLSDLPRGRLKKVLATFALFWVLIGIPAVIGVYDMGQQAQQPYTIVSVQKLILSVEDRSYFDLEGHERSFTILQESVDTSYRLSGNSGRIVLPSLGFSMLKGVSARTATWDGGGADNNWSTAANWDGPDILPVANDAVVFNATSVKASTVDIAVPVLASITIGGTGSIYSGTITVGIAQTNTWGAVTFAAGTTGTVTTGGFAVTMGSLAGNAGTLTLGASTLTMKGNFNNASMTFNRGTSTVDFATAATLTSDGDPNSGRRFYNLTIDASITVSQNSDAVVVANVFTVNGGYNTVGGSHFAIILNSSALNPFVIGGSGTVNLASIAIQYECTAACNVTATTYRALGIGTASGTSTTLTAQGAITVTASLTWTGAGSTGLLIADYYSNPLSIPTFALGGNTITFSAANMRVGPTVTGPGILSTGGGAINGNPDIFVGASSSIVSTTSTVAAFNVNVQATSAFITSTAAGSWTVAAAWTNTSKSTSWSFVAPITFNSSVNVTIKPADGCLGNIGIREFGNVTFSSASAPPVTFSLGNGCNDNTLFPGMQINGDLTISDSASTTTVTKESPTAGTQQLDIHGTVGFTIGSGGIYDGNNAENIIIDHGLHATAGTLTNSGAGSAQGCTTVDGSNPLWGFGVGGGGINDTIETASGAQLCVLLVNATMKANSNLSTRNYQMTGGGSFTLNGFAFTVGNGGMSPLSTGASLVAGASTVTVSGVVNISNPAFFITSTSLGTWTVSGAWTNASTSASWSFAAPITFNSTANQTMTFAGSNLTGDEFTTLTFQSTSGTVTFTISTRDLVATNVFAQGTAATTTISIGAGRTIKANQISITPEGTTPGGRLTKDGVTIRDTVFKASVSTARITLGTFVSWNVPTNGDLNFTNDTTTSNTTITIGNLTVGGNYEVDKNGVLFTTKLTTVPGGETTGHIQIVLAGGDPEISFLQITLSTGPGGGGGSNPLVASFTFAQTQCSVIAFTSTVTWPDRDKQGTYVWNFGDNTPGSTDANPIHAYALSGQYLVTMVAASASGISGSIQHLVNVVTCAPIVASVIIYVAIGVLLISMILGVVIGSPGGSVVSGILALFTYLGKDKLATLLLPRLDWVNYQPLQYFFIFGMASMGISFVAAISESSEGEPRTKTMLLFLFLGLIGLVSWYMLNPYFHSG